MFKPNTPKLPPIVGFQATPFSTSPIPKQGPIKALIILGGIEGGMEFHAPSSVGAVLLEVRSEGAHVARLLIGQEYVGFGRDVR